MDTHKYNLQSTLISGKKEKYSLFQEYYKMKSEKHCKKYIAINTQRQLFQYITLTQKMSATSEVFQITSESSLKDDLIYHNEE